MGHVNTEITLKNSRDVIKAEDGHIPMQNIRQLTTFALVDTGAGTLVIDETTRDKLGLRKVGDRDGTLANSKKEKYGIVGPVEVHWENRFTVCHALVLPGADEILLGVVPLEAMDLMVDTVNHRLVGAHGDQVVLKIK